MMDWFCCCCRPARHGQNNAPLLSVTDIDVNDDYTVDDLDLDMEGTSTTETSTIYKMSDIQAATNGFSHANKLDEGSYGAVYRGMLPDGTQAAIKVLKLERIHRDEQNQRKRGKAASKYSGQRSFEREAEVLGKYRHPNIVALLGHCAGTGPGERPALVYEFMDGASLKHRLRASRAMARRQRQRRRGGGSAEGNAVLHWRDRLKIASDTARALEFLHLTARPPVVHQDIKSDNILLGIVARPGQQRPLLIAKVADFGTARVAPKLIEETHESTKHLVGTAAYMAPEYCTEGHVSEKTDAYAFGVVLLELLTGRAPRDRAQNNRPLATDLARVLESRESVEQQMPGHLDAHAGGWAVGMAVEAGDVARRCLELVTHRRCCAADVRRDLDRLAGRGRHTGTSSY